MPVHVLCIEFRLALATNIVRYLHATVYQARLCTMSSNEVDTHHVHAATCSSIARYTAGFFHSRLQTRQRVRPGTVLNTDVLRAVPATSH